MARRYAGDARKPDLIALAGLEVPTEQVRCGGGAWITASGSTLIAPRVASEPYDFHQASYPPASASYYERTRLGVYTRRAVGLATPAMDLEDPLGESR
jgi:hypothetical protein